MKRVALEEDTTSKSIFKKVVNKLQVVAGSFVLNTAGFKLLRNQKIEIQVTYHPKRPGVSYEKVAVLCDNGEVRWIVIKGLCIDMYTQDLVEVRVPRTETPPDLPFDEKCPHSLGMGDLLPREKGSARFMVVNKR